MPSTDKIISEHIMEIRYGASGRFLDIRGSLAERFMKVLDFKYWQMGGDNRIDFFNVETKEPTDPETAFVSYKNIGYTVLRPATKHYFADRATKYITTVIEMDAFEMNPIQRVGVRGFFLVPFDGSFDTLLERYQKQVLSQSIDPQKVFGLSTVDIGMTLKMKGQEFSSKISSGPMEKLQVERVLKSAEGFPEVGLFCDIDVWKEDVGTRKAKDLSRLITDFNNSAWLQIEGFARNILGE